MAHKRNIGKLTDVKTIRARIVDLCNRAGATSGMTLVRKSQIGYAAFPDYDFAWPQGAAFSVAKIVSDMENDGLLRFQSNGERYGYYLTQKGQQERLQEPAAGQS